MIKITTQYFLAFWFCFHCTVVLATPEKAILNGKVYINAFQSNTEQFEIVELIPEGDDIKHFKEMVGLWRFKNINSPKEYADSLGYMIESSPNAQLSSFFVDPNDPDSIYIVFLAMEGNSNEPIFELNFWRITKGIKTKVIAYQYAIRHYGLEGIEGFLQNTLKNEKFITEVAGIVMAIPKHAIESEEPVTVVLQNTNDSRQLIDTTSDDAESPDNEQNPASEDTSDQEIQDDNPTEEQP